MEWDSTQRDMAVAGRGHQTLVSADGLWEKLSHGGVCCLTHQLSAPLAFSLPKGHDNSTFSRCGGEGPEQRDNGLSATVASRSRGPAPGFDLRLVGIREGWGAGCTWGAEGRDCSPPREEIFHDLIKQRSFGWQPWATAWMCSAP